MRPSRLLLAALLLPAMALAQDLAPPPPAPPPAAPVYPAYPVATTPPPPPALQAQVHRRDSWYIGFGLGTGSGRVTANGETRTFADMNIAATTNVALNFKVGATLTPTLLLGLDVSAVRAQSTLNGVTTAVQVTNYDAMLTWFPSGTGFLLRGGLGLSALRWDLDVLGSSSYGGSNLTVGAGYAFWVGQQFNLTANLDYSIQGYRGSSAPDRSGVWALWVGFDWY